MEINENSDLFKIIDHVYKEYKTEPSTKCRVDQFKEVIWNNSSLGFENPKTMYSQVLTHGYDCVLRVGETKFIIHTDKELKNIQALPACKPEPETTWDPLQKILDTLRDKHFVSTDQVIIKKFEEVVWNDSSLGFPDSTHVYMQVLTPGYDCELMIGKTRFLIHTDKDLKNIRIVRPDRFMDHFDSPEEAMKALGKS